MMLRRLFSRDNQTTGISIADWSKMFRPGASVAYNGRRYQAFQTSVGPSPYYDNNAVVFACQANRLLLFSEARFQFQQLRGGRPGDLFGTPELAILEEPWPGATTRDLLVQVDLDVLAFGNSYWVRDAEGRYLVRLDPARTKLVTSASRDRMSGRVIGERLVAYAYLNAQGEQPTLFEPGEVAHHKPYPDARNRFIGCSWLSACLPDIEADDSMTEHKRTGVRDGASLGYVVSLDKDIEPDAFEFFVDKFRSDHERPENAGKTLFLGGGADVKTVGQTFDNLQFKAVQGAGETRIAACSGVPPVIVGLSEGLSSATYSNYGQARRRLVDGTMRPLWGFFASAMSSIVPPGPGARLWYDDRDIPFLREDVSEQATILSENARTVVALINGGYKPDDVIGAVQAGDLARLSGAHTGLVSVQLQPPGTKTTPPDGAPPEPPVTNGKAALPAPKADTGPSAGRPARSTHITREQTARRVEANRRGFALVVSTSVREYIQGPDGKFQGSTPGDHAQVAKEVAAKAAAAEPPLTEKIGEVVRQHGGMLRGTEFRLKAEDSLARKIGDRVALGQTPEEAAASVKDALRYTAEFPHEEYVGGVDAVSSSLREAGATELEMKNYWEPGDAYQGINSVWRDESGQKFEVQFHTPESYSTKQDTTLADYHVMRDSSASIEDRTAAYDRMVAAAAAIPIPPDVMTIGTSMGVLPAMA